MKLIAVSGGSGSGKTTTLSEIENRDYIVVKQKTARSILEDWKTDLQSIYSDINMTMKYQDELIFRKYATESRALSELIGKQNLIFTERTFADLFTFTVINLGKFVETKNWMQEYYERCIEYQQLYTHVFYLSSGHFDVKGDTVRVDNPYYANAVNISMIEFTKQITNHTRLTFIDTPSLQQRCSIITTQSTIL